MKRILLLLTCCLGWSLASSAQNLPPQAPPKLAPVRPSSVAPKPTARPKLPTLEQSLAKARFYKSKRNYSAAQEELWLASDLHWRDARPYYMMGWIAIAQKDRDEAIYAFRTALKNGLKGKDAVEARGALRRMGVSEQFPKRKRRPISLASRLSNQIFMAGLIRPTVGEWAVQTAGALLLSAIGWAVTMLVISWASRQKFGKFDLKVIAFWCLTLLLLRVASQFFVPPYKTLPLTLAYTAFSAGLFLAALFYGFRRLTTKKEMDKGGIIAWGSFYTLLFLMFAGPGLRMGSTFTALAVIGAGLWLLNNPWYVTSQRAEKMKKKGDVVGAVALMERFMEKPRLSAKSRFALLNDLSSNYLTLNEPQLAIERANSALQYVHAFKSAEVLPRVNLAEAHGMRGETHAAIDQLSHVWHLTETSDCIMSNALWQGTVHGLLATTNYWRGWLDEAERQADLCLEGFPPEQRSGTSTKNLVAMSRAIKGAARLAAGDLETAHKYVAAAPKIGPQRGSLAFVHFVSSQVHEASGQIEEAKNLARAALEASPGFFPAQLQLADLSAQTGEKELAISILQEALPANSRHHLAPFAATKLRSWGGQVPPELELPAAFPATESSNLSSSNWERTTI